MTPFAPDDAPRLRLLLPELLDARGWSWVRLAAESGGRISRSTAHRLVSQRDTLKMFDAAVCEALCEMLDVTPGELFARPAVPAAKRRSATATMRHRAR